jgi:hypothetical protein
MHGRARRPLSVWPAAAFTRPQRGVPAQKGVSTSENKLDTGVDDIANFLADLQLAQDRFEGLLVRPQARELCLALDAALAMANIDNLERRRSYTYTSNSSPTSRIRVYFGFFRAGDLAFWGRPSGARAVQPL